MLRLLHFKINVKEIQWTSLMIIILGAIGGHCLDQQDLKNENIWILSISHLFIKNFPKEKPSFTNYSVIMKYSLHGWVRINAWFSPFIYQFSKQELVPAKVIMRSFFLCAGLYSLITNSYLMCFNTLQLLSLLLYYTQIVPTDILFVLHQMYF